MAISVTNSEMLMNSICQHIDADGPLSFADFMNMALYEPGLGYYRSGLIKFGRDGDFVTAPELSPLFAQCLARQCIDVLETIGGDVFEIGAGSGRLAADLLLALEMKNSLPAHYYILELSGELKQRQYETLKEAAPHLLDRVRWLSTWPTETFMGVVLANELLDAMPVHRFVINNGIEELYVTHDQQQLRWLQGAPHSQLLVEQLDAYNIDFAKGYSSEISLLVRPWLKSLATVLKRAVVLLFDYGYPRHEYYHKQRNLGTLMCHYRHQAQPDPLIHVGEQDITAFVDFTLVAEAADDNGLDVLGFTHQSGFLMDCEIMSLLDTTVDAAQYYKRAQQVKQLLLPGQMGEVFKVMALAKDYDKELLGFRRINQLRRL